MRTVAGCCGVFSVVLLINAPSTAQAVWCANYSNGGNNCGFSTLEQCRATVSGVGGSCSQSGGDQGARSVERTQVRRKAIPREKSTVTIRKPTQAARDAPRPAVPPAPITTAAAPTKSATPFNPNAFAVSRQLILDGKYEVGLAAMQASGPDTNPDVASYVGLALRKLGRIDEARSWYDKALAADPKHLQTLAFYGVLRVEQGDLAGARTDLQTIRSICGNTSCNEYVGLAGVIAAKSQ